MQHYNVVIYFTLRSKIVPTMNLPRALSSKKRTQSPMVKLISSLNSSRNMSVTWGSNSKVKCCHCPSILKPFTDSGSSRYFSAYLLLWELHLNENCFKSGPEDVKLSNLQPDNAVRILFMQMKPNAAFICISDEGGGRLEDIHFDLLAPGVTWPSEGLTRSRTADGKWHFLPSPMYF